MRRASTSSNTDDDDDLRQRHQRDRPVWWIKSSLLLQSTAASSSPSTPQQQQQSSSRPEYRYRGASFLTDSAHSNGGEDGGSGEGHGGKRDWGWVRCRRLDDDHDQHNGHATTSSSATKEEEGKGEGGDKKGEVTATAMSVLIDDQTHPRHGDTVTVTLPHPPSSSSSSSGGAAGAGDGADVGALPGNAWETFDAARQAFYDSYGSDSDDSDEDSTASSILGDDGGGGGDAAAAAVGGGTKRKRRKDEPPDDLIHLTHLHEPAVVHALRRRYDVGTIYTDTGPILLALNPFRECGEELYSDKVMGVYRKRGERLSREEGEEGGGGAATGGGGAGGRGDDAGASARDDSDADSSDDAEENVDETALGPHVYAVADRAYRAMASRLHASTAPSSSASTSSSPALKRAPSRRAMGGGGGVGGAGSPGGAKGGALGGIGVGHGGADQSILVSGESGAGKTVTTKILMSYLAALSRRMLHGGNSEGNDGSKEDDDKFSIERQVLESNPILESFGNARTVRNDNSSRFGKFIEMRFEAVAAGGGMGGGGGGGGRLAGASIETYLLEKVRLISQAPGERNYHVFYEMLTMSDDLPLPDENEGEEEVEDDRYCIEGFGPEDFRMTGNSGTYDRRDGIDDSWTYRELREAMDTMGFGNQEQCDIFTVTCALLHASNLTFNSLSADECALDRDNPHLGPVSSLLGVSDDAMNRSLCYFSIKAGKETHVRTLPEPKALKGVEALIKATYGALFEHIVCRINESIAARHQGGGIEEKKSSSSSHAPRGASSRRRHRSGNRGGDAIIGVLDIFGFESFQTNSFEQLCINYCNEALQQQFNLFVLRNEQEEYNREGIPWTFIEFPENQDVLDLIDKKGSGILTILDDQCKAPGTTDKTFASAMYKKCSGHGRFEATSRQTAELLFGIYHYAGRVEYSTDAFVEKNRDELPREATDLLLSSSSKFVRHLAGILGGQTSAGSEKEKFRRVDASSPRGTTGPQQRATVGGQFSSQLQSLRRKIDHTSPHYVRCLKPNDRLVPDHFDAAIIADQLRCAGVIEAVRVSRLGYPQRYAHSVFMNRYRILAKRTAKSKGSKRHNPVKTLVKAIAEKVQKHLLGATNATSVGGAIEFSTEDITDGIQVGKTKVFLRRRAYDALERLRSLKILQSSIRIQAVARRFIGMRSYKRALSTIITLQRTARRRAATRLVDDMRRQHNATIIQMYWRRRAAVRSYKLMCTVVQWVQCRYRGSIDRALYAVLNRERKALVLQTFLRKHLALRNFNCQKRSAVIIQCALRSHLARKALRALKANAKDVQHISQERDRFRREADELRKEIAEMKEMHSQQSMEANDLGKAAREVAASAAELEELRKENVSLKEEKELLQNELETVKESAKQQALVVEESAAKLLELHEAKQALQSQVDNITASAEERERGVKQQAEEEIRETRAELQRVREENRSLLKDMDVLREAKPEQITASSGIAAAEEPKEISSEDAEELDRLRKENKSLIGEIKTLKESADVHDTDVANVSTRLSEAAAPSEASLDEINVLRQEKEALENELETLKVKVEQLESEGDESHESEQNQDQKDAATSQDDLDQICIEVENAARDIVMASTAEAEAELERLQKEVETLEKDLEETTRTAAIRIDELQRVNKSLREELEDVLEIEAQNRDELDILKAETEDMKIDLEQTAEAFAVQAEEMSELQKENNDLKEELAEAKAQRSSVTGSSEDGRIHMQVGSASGAFDEKPPLSDGGKGGVLKEYSSGDLMRGASSRQTSLGHAGSGLESEMSVGDEISMLWAEIAKLKGGPVTAATNERKPLPGLKQERDGSCDRVNEGGSGPSERIDSRGSMNDRTEALLGAPCSEKAASDTSQNYVSLSSALKSQVDAHDIKGSKDLRISPQSQVDDEERSYQSVSSLDSPTVHDEDGSRALDDSGLHDTIVDSTPPNVTDDEESTPQERLPSAWENFRLFTSPRYR